MSIPMIPVHVLNTDKRSSMRADTVVRALPDRRVCRLDELTVGAEAIVSCPYVLDDSPSVDHIRILGGTE